MNRSPFLLLALGGLVGLSGCAEYAYAGQRSAGYDRYPDDQYSSNDYRGTSYYRRVERDARDYANYLDRVLRLRNGEERRIRQILEDRTYALLRRTPARRHDRVYPFPRRSGRSQQFWRQIDRDIDRILDHRYREPYAYLNRYGETRYIEYYRYRTYDPGRRVWYENRSRNNDRGRNNRGYDDGERRPNNRGNVNQRDDRRDDRSDRREDRRDDRSDRREDRREDRTDRRDDRTEVRNDRPVTRQETRTERQNDRQETRTERQVNRQETRTERQVNRQETRTERQANRNESGAQRAPARTSQPSRSTPRRTGRNQN